MPAGAAGLPQAFLQDVPSELKAGPRSMRTDVDLKVQKITYCTDVEGHWEYFCNFVELSDGLRFEGPAKSSHKAVKAPELVLEDGWHFVFGGDASDKGPGTLRFLTAVVTLKKKHPDRVHLIMGNRDINKMRWTSELHEDEISKTTKDTPGAHWVPEDRRVTPWRFIETYAAAEEKQKGREDQVNEEVVLRYRTKAVICRYHLQNNMGSEGEFEFRRHEIAIMSEKRVGEVSDQEVVDSVEEHVAENGLVREYLLHAQLACLLGNTLFVHGQVVTNQYLSRPGEDWWGVIYVPDPSEPEGYRKVEDLEAWIRQINEWAHSQVEDWVKHPTWWRRPWEPTREGFLGRGGAELIAYGNPDSIVPSVVYSRYLEDDLMPKAYPPKLVKYLKESGVNRVVVGHTPHGNCPTVVRHNNLYLIMADTSFSSMKANLAYVGDNRGDAVSALTLNGPDCLVKGRLCYRELEASSPKRLKEISYKVPPGEDSDQHVGLIDRHKPVGASSTEQRFFVKARLQVPLEAEGPRTRYLLCHVQGFKTAYKEEAADSAEMGCRRSAAELASAEEVDSDDAHVARVCSRERADHALASPCPDAAAVHAAARALLRLAYQQEGLAPFKFGDEVQVRSATAGGWTLGCVDVPVHEGYITVTFQIGGVLHRKHLAPDSPNLRQWQEQPPK